MGRLENDNRVGACVPPNVTRVVSEIVILPRSVLRCRDAYSNSEPAILNPTPPLTAADLFERVQQVFTGRFELRQLVASSEVRSLFLARDVVLNRHVALRIHTEPNSRHRTWFELETELLAALDHPSIRAVYSAGYDGSWAYRVSKWIEGENVLQAVTRGPRPIPTVLQLARDLMSVLEYAHSQYIVLRRLIPANIMLDRIGRAVITDLRYANRCIAYADPDPEPSVEAFLAPETWHGHAGEPASDIYGAGAVLYFAVTGQPPAVNPTQIIAPRALREACPQALQRVILRALRPDPHDRYMNAAEMAADLLSELGDYEAPTAPLVISRPSDNPDLWEQRLRRALGDEYELLSELGRGGFGSVYRVRDLSLEREVALKVLHPYLTAQPEVVERFRREAQLAAQLRHPNIVSVHGTGGRAGLIWYTMAYVPGVNLAKVVQNNGPLPIPQVVQLMLEALDALAHAHQAGVVHRDLKPENLLFDAAGRVQITDFGLAIALQSKWGGASSHSGTPEYAAPEQLLGEPVDRRADLYSLAVVGYFALTGISPFAGGTVEAVLAKQTTGRLPDVHSVRDDVPPKLVDVLTKAASKNPADRYESADQLVAALRRAAAQVEPRPSNWLSRLFGGS